MPKRYLETDVFQAALDRLITLYEGGHRLIVSFSAGKDSGVCLELAILAARLTGRLPVEVIMRDEEILFPGSFEYSERIAARPEVEFHWVVPHHPVINYFNRAMPYFWTFDTQLSPDEWVRKPPSMAYEIPEINIQSLITTDRFPPAPGKHLYGIVGMRASESPKRSMGIQSSKGYITKFNDVGCANVRPIYDWMDSDVWKAVLENKWDYNHAYDVMHRMGLPRTKLRIAPPTMSLLGTDTLKFAAAAWPQWFDKVCKRLPGVRTAAMFGQRACKPIRRQGETWEDCYRRTCIEEAPAWIATRAKVVMDQEVTRHSRHSTTPYPQIEPCPKCMPQGGCWRSIANFMYMGDPFSIKQGYCPYVDPEFFRPGSGTWGRGKPAW